MLATDAYHTTGEPVPKSNDTTKQTKVEDRFHRYLNHTVVHTVSGREDITDKTEDSAPIYHIHICSVADKKVITSLIM